MPRYTYVHLRTVRAINKFNFNDVQIPIISKIDAVIYFYEKDKKYIGH